MFDVCLILKNGNRVHYAADKVVISGKRVLVLSEEYGNIGVCPDEGETVHITELNGGCDDEIL